MENEAKSKKKFYKRWWFWVIVVLVLIVIGASSNQTPQKVGENGTANATPSASAPAAQQTFNVGDVVQLGDSTMTVNKVTVTHGGEFLQPTAGNEFVNLNITIANTSNSSQYVTTLGQMFIRDAAGNSYQVTTTDITEQNISNMLDGQVIANSKRTGWVGFEVPAGDKGLQFQYDGSIFGGGTILVNLGNG